MRFGGQKPGRLRVETRDSGIWLVNSAAQHAYCFIEYELAGVIHLWGWEHIGPNRDRNICSINNAVAFLSNILYLPGRINENWASNHRLMEDVCESRESSYYFVKEMEYADRRNKSETE